MVPKPLPPSEIRPLPTSVGISELEWSGWGRRGRKQQDERLGITERKSLLRRGADRLRAVLR
jgi:hypothetical protein